MKIGQKCYEVGDLRVDPGVRRATRGGREVPLPGLTFDLLMALIHAAPDILSFDAMAKEVWNGQIVSPETVTQRVKLLRDALGDDSQNPRYVAGARGQGYRLIPPVTPAGRFAGGKRPLRFGLGVTALLLIAAAAIIFRPEKEAYRADSIAVLPFENRSVRPEDAFLADGIHDDLLTRLSRMQNLRVIARSSVLGYRDRNVPTPEIARQLGVTAILKGAVQRSGDQVRIHVQLIDAPHDTQVWAETYDRSLTAANVFAIQSEISRAIATRLRIALLPSDRERLEQAPTASLAAYEAWLKGRQEMNRYTPGGLAAAVTHFQEAIAADPDFALAHVGLAESRLLQARFRLLNRDLAVQLADSSVERALALDPTSAEAFAAKGDVLRLRNDGEGAEAAFRQAIALNANLSAALISYGWLLGEQSRNGEQMEMWRRAGLVDPRSPVSRVHRAFSQFRAGGHADAEHELRALLAQHPEFPPAHVILGEVRAAVGDQVAAIGHYRRALELNAALPLAHVGLVGALLDLEADSEAALAIERAWAVPDLPQLGPKLELARAVQSGNPSRHQRDWIASLRSSDPVAAAHRAALVHLHEGRLDAARGELETAEPRLARQPGELPLEGSWRPLLCTYAFTLIGLGEGDRGRAIARSVLDRIEAGPDYARRRHEDPIVCYAALGESPQALTILATAAAEGVPSGWRSLLARPELAEVRKLPELERVVARIRAEAARQRRLLR